MVAAEGYFRIDGREVSEVLDAGVVDAVGATTVIVSMLTFNPSG